MRLFNACINSESLFDDSCGGSCDLCGKHEEYNINPYLQWSLRSKSLVWILTSAHMQGPVEPLNQNSDWS